MRGIRTQEHYVIIFPDTPFRSSERDALLPRSTAQIVWQRELFVLPSCICYGGTSFLLVLHSSVVIFNGNVPSEPAFRAVNADGTAFNNTVAAHPCEVAEARSVNISFNKIWTRLQAL